MYEGKKRGRKKSCEFFSNSVTTTYIGGHKERESSPSKRDKGDNCDGHAKIIKFDETASEQTKASGATRDMSEHRILSLAFRSVIHVVIFFFLLHSGLYI